MKKHMARVYIGDVGQIPEPLPKMPPIMPVATSIDDLSFRELCNLVVSLGVDIRDVIGIEECWMHEGMIIVGSNTLPEGYNLFEHCKYCKNCWQTFRKKRI